MDATFGPADRRGSLRPGIDRGVTAGTAAATGAGQVSGYHANARFRGSAAIAVKPDGALWFTAKRRIGRITTTGADSQFVNNTKAGYFGIDQPQGITTGPDGALWFTNPANNSIGRITTTGAVSTYTGAAMNAPRSIAAGPDGALWFTNETSPSIGRITTAGASTKFKASTVLADRIGDGAVAIVAGPDGAMWFTSAGHSAVGRITTNVTPQIAATTPPSGAAGTTVTMTGQNFTGATGVAFNGSPATIVSRRGAEVVVTVPAGATSGPVTLNTPAGTATSTQTFTVG